MSVPPPPTRRVPDLPEAPEPPAPQDEPRPAWQPWTAPAALIGGLILAFFGAIVVGVIAHGAVAGPASAKASSPAVVVASTIVQDAALVFAAVFFAMRWRMPRAAHFGLRRPAILRAVATLAGGWAAYYLFSAIWSVAIGGGPEDNLPKELGADQSTLALYVVLLLTTVIAPICEEVFFRGYFFTAVSNWRGWRWGAVITGVVFGLIHVGSAPAVYLVPLGVFGLILCVIYHRTGSLYPCIALHVFNNALAFGVTQHWSWQIPLVMVAANLVAGAIVWPLARRRMPVRA